MRSFDSFSLECKNTKSESEQDISQFNEQTYMWRLINQSNFTDKGIDPEAAVLFDI